MKIYLVVTGIRNDTLKWALLKKRTSFLSSFAAHHISNDQACIQLLSLIKEGIENGKEWQE